jgi:hypothetical protein
MFGSFLFYSPQSRKDRKGFILWPPPGGQKEMFLRVLCAFAVIY